MLPGRTENVCLNCYWLYVPLWQVGVFSLLLNTSGRWTENGEWTLFCMLFLFFLPNEKFHFVCVSALQQDFQVGWYFDMCNNTWLQVRLFKGFLLFWRQTRGYAHQYVTAVGTKQRWTWLNRLVKLVLWLLCAVGIL